MKSHEVTFTTTKKRNLLYFTPRDWLASPVSDVNYGKHFDGGLSSGHHG